MKHNSSLKLLETAVCPHCWLQFAPHDILHVAAHPSLMGDPRLGDDVPSRFRAMRFFVDGSARDELGSSCSRLACPRCHLIVPQVTLELAPWFVSIVGAQTSGKSYFLASMARCLRRCLPEWFKLSFTDTEAQFNLILSDYEQQLFASNAPHEWKPAQALIEKTRPEGHTTETVLVDGRMVRRPRPFMFTLRPQVALEKQGHDPSRVIVLYDNPGESYLPGADTTQNPVTEHLAKSEALLFLFDPLHHSTFRRVLTSKNATLASNSNLNIPSQHLSLAAMGERVRSKNSSSQILKHDKPLIVIVTKSDVWGPVLMPQPVGAPHSIVARKDEQGQTRYALNLDRIEELSQQIRKLLKEYAPEIVSAAEGFANQVTYFASSVLGTSPVLKNDDWCIQPGAIKPVNVEVPLLYALSRTVPGSIQGLKNVRRKEPAPGATVAPPNEPATGEARQPN